MASPPLSFLVNLPATLVSVTWLPRLLVTAVRASYLAPVTVSSYETVTLPSEPVAQAVPGIEALSARVETMLSAEAIGVGAAEACVASMAVVAASPAAAITAATLRTGRSVMVSLLTRRTHSGRTRPGRPR
jgi:hypothetical protein